MSDTEHCTGETERTWERIKRKYWGREWDLDAMLDDE